MPKKVKKVKANVRTRRAILELLKRDGPTEAKTMAKSLKISAMAVRQHLYELCDQKLVTFQEDSSGVGRPAKHWKLTLEADKFFPNGHADLAVNLIDSIRTSFGQKGIEKLVKLRSKVQASDYNKRIPHKATLKKKLDRLAEIRTEEGYMAEIQKEGENSFLLIENHCPICSAATACTGLCAAELSVFQSVLGKEMKIERTEHILSGARRCAYRIKKN